MISIELDEKSVFMFDVENLTVHLWDHECGKWDGPVIGQVGKIKFAGEWQVRHFMEMLELILENSKNGNKTEKTT